MKKNNKRFQGARAESIAFDFYSKNGWSLIERNFTIRGGEIDGIFENPSTRCFVEVKLINTIEDLGGYITFFKKRAIKRTIYTYAMKFPTYKYLRIDVVFIKDNRIIHIFENITL